MIEALFFDIDGTLVSINTHKIPESTISAIAEARKRGIKIFISTGRPPVLMNNIGQLQERGLIDGYVTMNGCYCFMTGQEGVEDGLEGPVDVIYESAIPENDVRAMADFCRERDLCCLFVGRDRITILNKNQIYYDTFVKGLNAEEQPEATWTDIPDYDVFQLTPFIDQATEDIVAEHMPGSEFNRWHPVFLDIDAKGNTKDHGIAQIAAHFGLKPENIMTFGDGGNDISMLEYAGTGVAMGNASDEVKSHADYITSSVDEDGIAKALRHYGII